jgi:rare lipoprotein A (peptidoglycan hydrolase)
VEDKLKERIRTGIPINKRLTAMGVMIKGNSFTATNKHLALHRTAPAGSYIKITNPNNGRSTFVRVLGNIQNVDADKGVDIKLSKAACQAIGIVDAKFPVELEYNE